MTAIQVEVRSGVYYDSVILMQLQRSLAEQPGVIDCGVVMGTDANKDLLAQSNLLVPDAQSAGADDTVIVIKADDDAAAGAALAQVDELLAQRKSSGVDADYRPKKLSSAAQMLPEAQWVLISTPGRYAADVARQALHLDKNVFLYSDNVTLDDEIDLKRTAAEKGLLVMGPDCGTAIVNGIGLGFANKVRHGPIGMLAASGTGLQQVSVRIHQMGGGLTQALGTGGRDLSEAVDAVTARQELDLLIRDPNTRVIVLVSKPPSPKVAGELVESARKAGKPVVVDFIGYATTSRRIDDVYFASTFDETAELAVQLSSGKAHIEPNWELDLKPYKIGQRYLRGLFSGGTLAYEALLILQNYLPEVYSNVPLDKKFRLEDSLQSQAHTIVDLGEDEFTVGRLHPMMDNDLRIRRLEIEASDPGVAVILLDVVLGFGAHPDPASELAPAIAKAKAIAEKNGRYLEVVAVVSGTDEDPQDFESQKDQLWNIGVKVETSNDAAVRYAARLARALEVGDTHEKSESLKRVNLDVINKPLAAINVGLESFTDSLIAQQAQVVHVDWKPAAGGNERLMSILQKLRT